MTPEGFLNCYMRVAKVGDLQYRNADGSTRTEYVSEGTLFNADSTNTLKGKPVTLEHPPALLTAETAKDYLTGSTLNLVKYDGSFLGVMATIHDKPTIDAVRSGKAREVSCGYTCDLVKRADGKYEQKNRQYNHVAITRKGRAGSSVAVHMDSVSDANIWTQIRGDSMPTDELFQIEIAGSVTRVDAETYQLIRQEQQQRLDAEKKMTAMQAKMAKLRAMQGGSEDDEDEDEDMEDMPKKDASCGTRKDGYAKKDGKAKPKVEPMDEDMEDEYEDEDEDEERKDSFAHTDSVDEKLLEAMIENRLLKARLDAESVEPEEDEDMEEEEEEDEEEYATKKRKDAADILNTWIAVADELTPALVRGDAIVEGIEIEDGKLHFDSVDATDLKEAYIKLHGLDDVLDSANRYDSVAIDTAFKIAKKSMARIDSSAVDAPKNRTRETLNTAFKSSRHDSSDLRFASIADDIEAGRKRLGR